MLSTGKNEEIIKMFNDFKRDAENLVKTVIELVWYMRGSISYDDMMFRTPGERGLISDFINKRLEGESKKDFPVY